jgi:hypothetical protein
LIRREKTGNGYISSNIMRCPNSYFCFPETARLKNISTKNPKHQSNHHGRDDYENQNSKSPAAFFPTGHSWLA